MKSFKNSLFLCMFFVGILSMIFSISPRISWADGGDAQLQTIKSDFKACMQQGPAGQVACLAFSQKYNVPLSKVNDIASRSSQSNDVLAMDVLCALEKITVIGLEIWSRRAGQDPWWSTGARIDGSDYCLTYSLNCGHWDWRKNCLQTTGHVTCYKSQIF